MTRRLKRAARWERARRYVAAYLMSGCVLLLLLAPFWLVFYMWNE